MKTDNQKGPSTALLRNNIGFPPNPFKRSPQHERLGFNRPITAFERLEVQWVYLRNIMKGMANCSSRGIPRRELKDGTISTDGKVRINVYENGGVCVRGTIKCNGLECSVCGSRKRREMAEVLEMAFQMNAYKGGRNAMATGTQIAHHDPEKTILAASKAMAYILKKLNKWNDKNGYEVALFSTQETLFSPDRGYFDSVSGAYFHRHYYHSHIHLAILFPPEMCRYTSDHLLYLIKTWWFNGLEKAGGRVKNRFGKIAAEAFRKDGDFNEDRAIARYITKNLKSMELVYAATKTEGKNLSLEDLKASIYHQTMVQDYSKRDSYVKLMKGYFEVMKGRSRFKSTKEKLGSLVAEWIELQTRNRMKRAWELVAGMNSLERLAALGRVRADAVLDGLVSSYHTIQNQDSWGHALRDKVTTDRNKGRSVDYQADDFVNTVSSRPLTYEDLKKRLRRLSDSSLSPGEVKRRTYQAATSPINNRDFIYGIQTTYDDLTRANAFPLLNVSPRERSRLKEQVVIEASFYTYLVSVGLIAETIRLLKDNVLFGKNKMFRKLFGLANDEVERNGGLISVQASVYVGLMIRRAADNNISVPVVGAGYEVLLTC